MGGGVIAATAKAAPDPYHGDYWFNYVHSADPGAVKAAFQEYTLDFGDATLHLDLLDPAAQSGAGSASPVTVIFIHGTSVYSRFYAGFLYKLAAQGLRVVAPDLPGHGLSGGRRGHFTLELLVRAVSRVVDWALERRPGPLVLMGSSLGGIAALLSEGAHRQLVRVKGLYRMLVPLAPGLARLFPRLRFRISAYLPMSSLASGQDGNRITSSLCHDPLLVRHYTLAAIHSQMTAAPARPLEEIRTPIMLISGERDRIFPAEYMAELFQRLTCPHKALELIPGAPHLILNQCEDESLARILPWLRKVVGA
jgi:alpha-beta hydrolase superfamily lysophospholipase